VLSYVSLLDGCLLLLFFLLEFFNALFSLINLGLLIVNFLNSLSDLVCQFADGVHLEGLGGYLLGDLLLHFFEFVLELLHNCFFFLDGSFMSLDLFLLCNLLVVNHLDLLLRLLLLSLRLLDRFLSLLLV